MSTANVEGLRNIISEVKLYFFGKLAAFQAELD